MIITIDGPIATGKSTIAKKLAEKIGYIYFDTGASYRCFTYFLLKNNVPINNIKAILPFLDIFHFDIRLEDGEKHYYIDHENVTHKIRTPEVTKAVSQVSAYKEVRKHLVALQKQWAEHSNAVFEGRDLGTVVFPHAPVKIYLMADIEIRAKRRFDELRTKFPHDTTDLTMQQTIEDVKKRDYDDSTREIAPLRQPEDAFVIDTSQMTTDQIVNKIIEYIKQKQGENYVQM